MRGEATVRAVIVSDGKRGHENQSRVVARMLGDSAPLLMLLRDSVREGGLVELLLRMRFALFGRRAISQRRASELVKALLRPEHPDEFRAFAQEYASSSAGVPAHDTHGDHRGSPHREEATTEARSTGKPRLFVVSTGTPPATLNLLLARLLGAQSVVNMTPSLLPRARFDLNIVPEHDLRAGQALPANLIATPLALGYHDEAAARLLVQQLVRDNSLDPQEAYIGLAVGGPSRSAPWDNELVHAALGALHSACAASGQRLLVTTSRRTPAATLDFLRGWQGGGVLAYLLDAGANPLNPLPAFYELARAMVVTADSFSMASEALHAGHGPLLLPANVTAPLGRLRKGLELLASTGLVIHADDALEITQFVEGPPERSAANAIYDELGAVVRRRLQLDSGPWS